MQSDTPRPDDPLPPVGDPPPDPVPPLGDPLPPMGDPPDEPPAPQPPSPINRI